MTEHDPLDGTMDQIKARAIARALRLCGGNRTHAARRLDITIRTLSRWIETTPELRDEFPPLTNQYDHTEVPHA